MTILFRQKSPLPVFSRSYIQDNCIEMLELLKLLFLVWITYFVVYSLD